MMTKSKIEWTDRTWNPTVGCARVSPGCEHCYAETMAARCVSMSAAQGRESVYLPVVDVARRRWNRTCVTVPERLEDPLRWKKPAMVFVNSMSDLFHDDVPFEFIAAVFGIAAATPRHTYQILTKRPERMREFFRWIEHEAYVQELDTADVCTSMMKLGVGAEVRTWPLPNVHLGVSVEDQARAEERIPVLLECPAELRFLSCEPLLGPVDIAECLDDEYAPRDHGGAMAEEHGPSIGWVIVGGESGPGARDCEVAWVRSIVDQCKAADVPVFVKQLGARPVVQRFGTSRDQLVVSLKLKSRKGADPSEWPADLRVQEMPPR